MKTIQKKLREVPLNNTQMLGEPSSKYLPTEKIESIVFTPLQVAAGIQQAVCCELAPGHSVNFTGKDRRVTGNQNVLVHRVLSHRSQVIMV